MMLGGFPQHVELSRILQTEILKDDRPHQLCRPSFNQVLNFGVEESELLALMLISLPHGPDQVDLTRGEPIGGHDHIVSLVIDWDGPERVYHGEDVVPVDSLLPGLSQHTKGGVQTINKLVAVLSNLPAQEASAARQVQDRDIPVQ